MVKYLGRPKSDNIRKPGDIRSRFDAKVPEVPPKQDVGLPGIDLNRVIGEVNFRVTNRPPELWDNRIDEYVLDDNKKLTGMPVGFLLDSFKRAREVGLPVDWTRFKK